MYKKDSRGKRGSRVAPAGTARPAGALLPLVIELLWYFMAVVAPSYILFVLGYNIFFHLHFYLFISYQFQKRHLDFNYSIKV